MEVYFVHNGYCGCSYGVPSDPQLINVSDAAEIMKRASLTSDQVKSVIPPAQYAEENDYLYKLTGGNRFICFGDIKSCADINENKIRTPMRVHW